MPLKPYEIIQLELNKIGGVCSSAVSAVVDKPLLLLGFCLKHFGTIFYPGDRENGLVVDRQAAMGGIVAMLMLNNLLYYGLRSEEAATDPVLGIRHSINIVRCTVLPLAALYCYSSALLKRLTHQISNFKRTDDYIFDMLEQLPGHLENNNQDDIDEITYKIAQREIIVSPRGSYYFLAPDDTLVTGKLTLPPDTNLPTYIQQQINRQTILQQLKTEHPDSLVYGGLNMPQQNKLNALWENATSWYAISWFTLTWAVTDVFYPLTMACFSYKYQGAMEGLGAAREQERETEKFISRLPGPRAN